MYIRRKSQIGCKFRERVELAVNSEKGQNWLSIWRKIQISYQFGDEANFLKKSGIFQVVGRLRGKCLNFRIIGFISKFTTNLAFSKLTDNFALSLYFQQIWLFLWIYSQFGSFSSFSKYTIKCILPVNWNMKPNLYLKKK